MTTWLKFPTQALKPFSAIPGPKSFPVIGTLGSYVVSRKYQFDRLHWNGFKKFNEFGPIVREEIVPGVNIVWLFDPDDIRSLFTIEGACPSRRSHLALQKYRMDRPHLYTSGGLLPTNGPEWAKLRHASQKPLALNSFLDKFIPEINLICDDFINILKSSSVSGQTVTEDFLDDLKRFFMEITGVVIVGQRLGSLNKDQSLISKELIKAAFQTNANILKTDNSSLWRIFPTREFRSICDSQGVIENAAMKFIQQSDENNDSLVSYFKRSTKLCDKDVLTLVGDMILAGIDTSSYTFSFLSFLLSKNLNVQNKLRSHIEKDLGCLDIIDRPTLKKFHYGKLVLKETLRLYPISVGIGRVLQNDEIIGGYLVPKSTVVVTQNQVSCRLPQYCPKPSEFLPERWDKSHPEYQALHPYLSLPFGFGPRSCIGRRMAEQSMHILMIKLLQNFRLEWAAPYQDLDAKSLLINQPDKPIKLKFNSLKWQDSGKP